jgi:hypothetical protein
MLFPLGFPRRNGYMGGRDEAEHSSGCVKGQTLPTPDGLVACEEAVSEWWLGRRVRRFASRVERNNEAGACPAV